MKNSNKLEAIAKAMFDYSSTEDISIKLYQDIFTIINLKDEAEDICKTCKWNKYNIKIKQKRCIKLGIVVNDEFFCKGFEA